MAKRSPMDPATLRHMQDGGAAAPVPDHCSIVGDVLSRVGDRWSLLAIAVIGNRAVRFNELRRMIHGISQRMLTVTLRGLERDGLVVRTVYPTVPVRVEYALTPLGHTLLGTVSALAEWAAANGAAIREARQRFDADALPASDGHPGPARPGHQPG